MAKSKSSASLFEGIRQLKPETKKNTEPVIKDTPKEISAEDTQQNKVQTVAKPKKTSPVKVNVKKDTEPEVAKKETEQSVVPKEERAEVVIPEKAKEIEDTAVTPSVIKTSELYKDDPWKKGPGRPPKNEPITHVSIALKKDSHRNLKICAAEREKEPTISNLIEAGVDMVLSLSAEKYSRLKAEAAAEGVTPGQYLNNHLFTT